MIGALVYTGITFYGASKKTFVKAGYVLSADKKSENSVNDNSVKYYFSENTSYKNSFDNTIEFEDTDGNSVRIDDATFVHYNDDSISLLKKGVIFNLDEIFFEEYFNTLNGVIIDNKIVVSDNSKWYEIKFEDKITPVNNSSYMTELYEKEINYLSEKGIIIGNENGELNLYNQITRAEFLTMIIRSLSCDIKECDAVFSDISEHLFGGSDFSAVDVCILRIC